MDWLRELGVIGLLTSADRAKRDVVDKQIAAAARRHATRMASTATAHVDRQKLAHMLARRIQEIAERRNLVAPTDDGPKSEQSNKDVDQ